MAVPQVVILRAAGANCDRETAAAFELAGARVETVHINQFTRGGRRLAEFQCLVIPGGFTYGDDVSAGRILANEMRVLLGDPLQEFLSSRGLVLGICNGFQALVKAGVLPEPNPLRGPTPAPGSRLPLPRLPFEGRGEDPSPILPASGEGAGPAPAAGLPGGGVRVQRATLAENRDGRFHCGWVRVKVYEAAAPPFLSGMDGEVLEIPVAHGEGRFEAPETVLQALETAGQVAFRYCGPDGELDDRFNVNGAALHAAGISGWQGRVLGLMPHPERHVFGVQHPRWTREGLQPEGQCLRLFRNAVRFLG